MKKRIAWWFFTAVIAWEMVAGSLWDLLQIPFVRGVFTELGYPFYLLTILGLWKAPFALVVLSPRWPRLKEWAYAGAFFNYTGAAASHLFAHDPPAKWIGPLVFAGFTLASSFLRAPEPTTVRPRDWIRPVALCAAFLVIALVTLPK